jgi:hypothetical protein
MSGTAAEEFKEARTGLLDHYEARRIRGLVNQARDDTHGAGVRWPFELTQNAHDPGARDGNAYVDVELTFDGKTVIYEHNGKPFTILDLAGLFLGGSSKEFESIDTTGRFGTGFLVTHVLSFKVNFTGLLTAADGLEEVSIQVDRSGDEREISESMTRCYEAIERAPKLAEIERHKTARFHYDVDNTEAAQLGITAFRDTLPYLYGTCEHLGIVSVNDGSAAPWRFTPEPPYEDEFLQCHVRVRRFTITKGSGESRALSAVRLRRVQDAASSLIVVTEETADGCELWVPSEGFPRIFCRFPVATSDFLPVSAVIDGRFQVRQERDRVLMKDTDREQIDEALALLPTLIQLGMERTWVGAHKLAQLGVPVTIFGSKPEENKELKDWWIGELGTLAQEISELPIVQTVKGAMKASGEAPIATFVLPRINAQEPRNDLDFDKVWEVASEVLSVYPPARGIAADWSLIASGWTELGVEVQRMGLAEIAEAVRDGAAALKDLKTSKEQLPWLIRFLELVGQLAEEYNCSEIIDNLLPNQNGKLRSPTALLWDGGISTRLKDIACSIGRDVRARLLLEDLAAVDEAIWPNLKKLLKAHITGTLDEAAVVKECIEELNKQLPDNKPVADDKSSYRGASIDLLQHLWESQGEEAIQIARQCPLIASDSLSIRWTAQRKALVPVSVWHALARPFSELYETDRVLSEEYVTKATGTRTIVNALVKWEMAFADPLCSDSPREVKDERLKAIAAEGVDCKNIIITNVPMSQIAHLPNQLIQRCQNDENLAKLLLGLTLTHIAVNDSSWRSLREIPARQDHAETTINVFPALWLADLKSKAWVPVRGEKDGKQVVQPVVADAGNLMPLLDPAWLSGNDAAIELLSRFFGFSPLELRLLSTVASKVDRNQVETELAKIVQALGGDPYKYSQLVTALASQQERDAQKEKNRRFGLAVQQIVEHCLDNRGLHLDFIDCGYDYDVFLEAPAIDAGTHHFQLANYLLEVKATTTGEVRMTPAQTQKACDDMDRFILCVVDLRGFTPDRVTSDWTPKDVEPRARVVVQIGLLANKSHSLVEQAKGCEIGIRNDSALRYGAPVKVWEGGLSLADWVDSLPLSS